MMGLTSEQIALIRSTIPALQEHGQLITSTFYKDLLTAHPSLRSMFNLTHQRTGTQPLALASVLAAYATHLTDPFSSSSSAAAAAASTPPPALTAVSNRHVSLGVTAPQYAVVSEFLLGAMERVLGDALTPEIKGAWAAAYGMLAEGMVEAERRMYEVAERERWEEEEDRSSPEGHFRKCKVVARTVEADGVVSLRLWPVRWEGHELPGYEAGQYVSVKVWVEGEAVGQIRQYTLSDYPERARRQGYRITPKKIGMASSVLHGLKEGDEVEVSFPRGVFFFKDEGPLVGLEQSKEANKSKPPLVLISAGIGLTPLLSILTSLLQGAASGGEDRKITWIHSSRSAEERPFRNELESLGREHANLRSRIFITGPTKDEKLPSGDFEGRVDLTKLDKEEDLYLGNEHTQYLLCGPSLFMESIGKAIKGLGIPGERIRAEVFGTGNLNL